MRHSTMSNGTSMAVTTARALALLGVKLAPDPPSVWLAAGCWRPGPGEDVGVVVGGDVRGEMNGPAGWRGLGGHGGAVVVTVS